MTSCSLSCTPVPFQRKEFASKETEIGHFFSHGTSHLLVSHGQSVIIIYVPIQKLIYVLKLFINISVKFFLHSTECVQMYVLVVITDNISVQISWQIYTRDSQ